MQFLKNSRKTLRSIQSGLTLFWRHHPDGDLKGTIFAHKIARERQSLFGQKCELVFVRKRTKAESDEGVEHKKDRTPIGVLSFFGGATQIRTGDRGVADLCLTTWPWRHIFSTGEL